MIMKILIFLIMLILNSYIHGLFLILVMHKASLWHPKEIIKTSGATWRPASFIYGSIAMTIKACQPLPPPPLVKHQVAPQISFIWSSAFELSRTISPTTPITPTSDKIQNWKIHIKIFTPKNPIKNAKLGVEVFCLNSNCYPLLLGDLCS